VIGDIAARVFGAVMTAAVLTCAVRTIDVLTAGPDAGDADTASAVCAAIGFSPDALSDEPAACAGPELPTARVGDARCADESVFAVGEVPRARATCTDRTAASRAIDGVLGADVTAGAEEDRAVTAAVGDVSGVWVGVAVIPPDRRTEADGSGLVPWTAAAAPGFGEPESGPDPDKLPGPADTPRVPAGPEWVTDPPAESPLMVSAHATA
jgi:hypothetical protein